jgi:hypothetical protein
MIPSLSRFAPALGAACIAMVLCGTASSAQAQEVRKVKFRTLCLAHAGGVTELAMPAAKAGQPPVAVPLYTASLSPVIEGSFATPEAVFHGKAAGADGKPVVAAKAPLGKSARQLFFFMPAKEGSPMPYEVRVFDDDTDVFKLGSIRAINLAPTPVRFTLGGDEIPEIAVGQSVVFPQAAKKDEFNMYPVALAFPDAQGKWSKVYSATWKASKERREIVVTMVDEQFKQPTVKVYPDIPPWTEKGAK